MEKVTVLMKATQINDDTIKTKVFMSGNKFEMAGAFAQLVKESYEKMCQKDEALAYATLQTIVDVCGYRRLVKK